MASSALKAVRYIGYVEGTSFLLLLGIAMPLKYLADRPEAVQVVGMAHGVLFILYALAAVWAAYVCRWSFLKLLGAAAASILPFGPFIFDARLRREEQTRPAPTTEEAKLG